jgi:hypothetical protein
VVGRDEEDGVAAVDATGLQGSGERLGAGVEFGPGPPLPVIVVDDGEVVGQAAGCLGEEVGDVDPRAEAWA